MNKAELLADLASRPGIQRVGNPFPAEDHAKANEVLPDVKWYRVLVLETGDKGRAQRPAVHFYVVDEGFPTEAAYYTENEPAPKLRPVLTPFADRVKARIAAGVASGVLLRGIIVESSEEQTFAVVRAFRLVAGSVTETRFFAYAQADGKIGFDPIG